jgi:16S rRNA (uracil1498-N3)-methyltransferase
VTGPDHRHLARVLRVRTGDPVTLFDGAGVEVAARVGRVGRTEVELLLGERREGGAAGSTAAPIVLLTAVPRGGRMDLLVQKTSELGVGRIVPLLTARSVARPEAGRRVRWEKIAREAARQCGRSDVPVVDDPISIESALGSTALPARRFALWEGEHGRSLGATLAETPGPAATALLVGPEGGLTAVEVEVARAAGFVPVGLGPRILRVETAAIVAVTLVQNACGGLG